MKKYLSFFRLRLVTGLQYRTAALAGMATQFFWGFMEIMVFHAFYEADPTAYPMTMEATSSYVWLQQGLLAFFGAWMFEGEIFDIIKDGNLAYELCRPIHIYDLWFTRSVAMRLSRAILRCIPILAVAVFLPKGYGLGSPASIQAFVLFVVSLVLGLLVMVALNMMVYVASLFTVSGDGLRILFCSVVDFLSGQILPLPFFPEKVQRVLELNPFASTGNVPFRIYSGNLSGQEMMRAIAMQVFWLIVLITAGKLIAARGEKRAIVQGG
ncbi:MAG: ABC transporter permease [Acetatifactor sp.]